MKKLSIQTGILFLSLAAFTARAQQTQTEYLRAVPVKSPAPAATTTTTTTKATVPATTTTSAPVAAAAPSIAATPAPKVDINDVARFIAGMPVTSGPLAAMEQQPEWTNFAASMNSRWARFDAGRLQPIRTWQPEALAHASTQRLFYPFSGPDYIYAATMFPNASTYILCGLEPVGSVPGMDKLQPIDATLGWLQASMKTLIEAGYFVTKDMKVELQMSPLQGTLPLMCVMLARHGDRITLIRSDSSHAEIHFIAAGGGPERTLYYFSADLSNGGMGRKSAFRNFLDRVRPDCAYVKSASYLMHEEEFSAVRNYLLTQCSTIVQDDSGVPLRFFNTNRWKLKLYGTYDVPLDIFAKYNQQDMAALYSKTTTTPLPFGAGYHWNPKTANLIVATAHSSARQETQASTPPSRQRR